MENTLFFHGESWLVSVYLVSVIVVEGRYSFNILPDWSSAFLLKVLDGKIKNKICPVLKTTVEKYGRNSKKKKSVICFFLSWTGQWWVLHLGFQKLLIVSCCLQSFTDKSNIFILQWTSFIFLELASHHSFRRYKAMKNGRIILGLLEQELCEFLPCWWPG